MNWPKLTPAEIAAFIGAAAWLPQIGQWIYGWVAKPKLRVVSGSKAEVGYTAMYGPIVNMTLAISTERKDAIIEKMTMEVQHDQGDKHVLTWAFLNENFSEIRNPAGETLEVTKNQPAIAMKVSTLTLTEKKVLFQDLEFQKQHGELTSKMGELWSHLNGNKVEKVGEQVIQSQEFSRARDYFRDNMYWKEGTYTLTVKVNEIRSKEPHVEVFEMIFTKFHVEQMRQNTETWERDTRELYLQTDRAKEQMEREKAGAAAQQPAEEGEKLLSQWQWAYPQVRRAKKKPA